MSEQIQDQISAFVDDELSFDESSFLVRRLERDPEARQRLVSYLTIGAAMRRELSQPDPNALLRRVRGVLGGSVPTTSSVVDSGWAQRLVKPALGIGIAASVAVVALATLRIGVFGPQADVDAAATAVVATTLRTEPPSYVVPQEIPNAQDMPQPIRLTNYLVHHGEYASGLGRTYIHSAVAGAQQAQSDVADATVEQ
jgi:negative regulator of sigma E activity